MSLGQLGCRLRRPDGPTIVSWLPRRSSSWVPLVFACFASWMCCMEEKMEKGIQPNSQFPTLLGEQRHPMHACCDRIQRVFANRTQPRATNCCWFRWQDTSIMLHPSVPFFHIAAIAVYCLLLLHLWNHPSKVRWNQPKSPWLWRTWLACPRQFVFSAAAECKCMRKRGGRWISILLGDCWTKSGGFQALQWPCHTLSTFSIMISDCLKNLYQSAHVQRFRSFFSQTYWQ